MGLWNHTAHFDDVFTMLWDGYPLEVCSPGTWQDDGGIGAQELRSGKYNTTVYKGHLGIGMHGCVHGHTGLHLGVDHDARMRADHETKYPRKPGEWQIGDLGYVGCEGMLYGCKRPTHNSQAVWDVDSEFWTNLIAFYRARVENVINQMKSHAWAKTPFRGSYETMALYHKISLVMTALEIRDNFETTNLSRFEVVGPWRHTF